MSEPKFYLVTCDETRIIRILLPTAHQQARVEKFTQNGPQWIWETMWLTEEEFRRMFPYTPTLPDSIEYCR